MSNIPFCVLIVDDNPEFVLSLKSLIVDVAGSSVKTIMTAFKGYDGLELMRDNSFDYVFMDIKMPDIDGVRAARFARFEYDKPQMKIIGVSFHSDHRYKSQMMQAGADYFLVKDEIDADRLLDIFNLNSGTFL
jgi:two-component system sensor histidine kinase BarA